MRKGITLWSTVFLFACALSIGNVGLSMVYGLILHYIVGNLTLREIVTLSGYKWLYKNILLS